MNTQYGDTLSWPSIDETIIPESTGFLSTGFKDVRHDERELLRKRSALEVLAESAPGIHRAVVTLWGEKELQNGMNRWVMEGYGGTALPYPICEALILLAEAHGRRYGFQPEPLTSHR